MIVVVVPLAGAQQSRVYQEGSNWAQEITGSLATAKNLKVKVDMGSVHVAGGASGINYTVRNRSYTGSEEKARREFDAYKVSAYVRGDTAWIVAEWDGDRPHKFSGEFTVNVPRDLVATEIETDGGSVTVTGLAGQVHASSGGGGVRLDDIGGAAFAETGGGSIDVGKTLGDLSLHTGGGSIKVESAKGRIKAETGGGSVVVMSGAQEAVLETGGGNIHLDNCSGRVKAETGGGSIELGDVGGPADIETGGGSIRLASAKGFVRASTGGGSIELDGVPSAKAETGAGGIVAKFVNSNGERNDSRLETSAGDITVYLPSDLHITIRASIDAAYGHSIRSDFPDIHVSSEGGDYGPKTVSAEGNLNGGGPTLKVTTTTGDIIFRRSR